MLTQTILCSLTTGKPDEPIYCRYGEKGRQIKFELINPIMDFTGYDAMFYLFKPDGNFVVETLTIDNSGEFATLTLNENMTSASGRGVWDIKLTKNNVVVYTFNGEMFIDMPTVTDEIIESVSAVNGYIFPDEFQTKLTAGENITIEDGTISSDYPVFQGSTSDTNGKKGIVPRPMSADRNKFLCGDGSWNSPVGGGSFVKETINLSGGSSAVELTHNISEYDFIGVTVSGGNTIHWFEIPTTTDDFYMGDVSNVNDYDQYALTQGLIRINTTNNTIQNVNMTMFHYIRSSYQNMYQNRSIVNVYLLRLKE